MSIAINSHGLGAASCPPGQTVSAVTGACITPQTTDLSPETIAACQGGWYWINPYPCWSMSPESWTAAAALPAAPYAVAGPVAQPCAYSATQVCTPADAQAASDAAIAQTQAAAAAAIGALPDNPLGTQPCEYFGLSCTTLMILGGGLALVLLVLGTASSGGPRIYAH
jgi:hypothetical protein